MIAVTFRLSPSVSSKTSSLSSFSDGGATTSGSPLKSAKNDPSAVAASFGRPRCCLPARAAAIVAAATQSPRAGKTSRGWGGDAKVQGKCRLAGNLFYVAIGLCNARRQRTVLLNSVRCGSMRQ